MNDPLPTEPERTRGFRPSRDDSVTRLMLKTFAQTVVFWVTFLALLPWAIIASERALGIPGLAFAGQGVVGVVLFAAGGTLGVTSSVFMCRYGLGTPLPLECPRRLVVRGPYRWIRNPMAVGGLGQGAAVGIAAGSWSVPLYVLAGAIVWHVFVRPIEERDLAGRFGDAYGRYRAAVRCWIPRVRPWADPVDDAGG